MNGEYYMLNRVKNKLDHSRIPAQGWAFRIFFLVLGLGLFSLIEGCTKEEKPKDKNICSSFHEDKSACEAQGICEFLLKINPKSERDGFCLSKDRAYKTCESIDLIKYCEIPNIVKGAVCNLENLACKSTSMSLDEKKILIESFELPNIKEDNLYKNKLDLISEKYDKLSAPEKGDIYHTYLGKNIAHYLFANKITPSTSNIFNKIANNLKPKSLEKLFSQKSLDEYKTPLEMLMNRKVLGDDQKEVEKLLYSLLDKGANPNELDFSYLVKAFNNVKDIKSLYSKLNDSVKESFALEIFKNNDLNFVAQVLPKLDIGQSAEFKNIIIKEATKLAMGDNSNIFKLKSFLINLADYSDSDNNILIVFTEAIKNGNFNNADIKDLYKDIRKQVGPHLGANLNKITNKSYDILKRAGIGSNIARSVTGAEDNFVKFKKNLLDGKVAKAILAFDAGPFSDDEMVELLTKSLDDTPIGENAIIRLSKIEANDATRKLFEKIIDKSKKIGLTNYINSRHNKFSVLKNLSSQTVSSAFLKDQIIFALKNGADMADLGSAWDLNKKVLKIAKADPNALSQAMKTLSIDTGLFDNAVDSFVFFNRANKDVVKSFSYLYKRNDITDDAKFRLRSLIAQKYFDIDQDEALKFIKDAKNLGLISGLLIDKYKIDSDINYILNLYWKKFNVIGQKTEYPKAREFSSRLKAYPEVLSSYPSYCATLPKPTEKYLARCPIKALDLAYFVFDKAQYLDSSLLLDIYNDFTSYNPDYSALAYININGKSFIENMFQKAIDGDIKDVFNNFYDNLNNYDKATAVKNSLKILAAKTSSHIDLVEKIVRAASSEISSFGDFNELKKILDSLYTINDEKLLFDAFKEVNVGLWPEFVKWIYAKSSNEVMRAFKNFYGDLKGQEKRNYFRDELLKLDFKKRGVGIIINASDWGIKEDLFRGDIDLGKGGRFLPVALIESYSKKMVIFDKFFDKFIAELKLQTSDWYNYIKDKNISMLLKPYMKNSLALSYKKLDTLIKYDDVVRIFKELDNTNAVTTYEMFKKFIKDDPGHIDEFLNKTDFGNNKKALAFFVDKFTIADLNNPSPLGVINNFLKNNATLYGFPKDKDKLYFILDKVKSQPTNLENAFKSMPPELYDWACAWVYKNKAFNAFKTLYENTDQRNKDKLFSLILNNYLMKGSWEERYDKIKRESVVRLTGHQIVQKLADQLKTEEIGLTDFLTDSIALGLSKALKGGSVEIEYNKKKFKGLFVPVILSYIKERKGVVEFNTVLMLKNEIAGVDRKDNYLWDSACSGNLAVNGVATKFLDLSKIDERVLMFCKITPEFVNDVVYDKRYTKIVFKEFEKLVNINMYKWDELVYIDKFIDPVILEKVLNTVYKIPVREPRRESFTKALRNLDYANDAVVTAAVQWFYKNLSKKKVKEGFGESLKIITAENAKKLVNALLYNNQKDLQSIINEPKWGLGDYLYEILLDLASKLDSKITTRDLNAENYFVALSKAVAHYPEMAEALVFYKPKDGSDKTFVCLTVKAYQSQGVYEALKDILDVLDTREKENIKVSTLAVNSLQSEGKLPLLWAFSDPERIEQKIDDTIKLLISKGSVITSFDNPSLERFINSKIFSFLGGYKYYPDDIADYFYWGFSQTSQVSSGFRKVIKDSLNKDKMVNLFLTEVLKKDDTKIKDAFEYAIINKDDLNVAEFVAKWAVDNNRQAEMKTYLSGLNKTQDEKDLRAKISNDIVKYLYSRGVKPEDIIKNNPWGLDLLSDKYDLGDGPGNLLTVFAKRFSGNDLMLLSLSLRPQVESLGANWIDFTKAARDDFIGKKELPLRTGIILGLSKKNDPYFGMDANQLVDLLKIFDINNNHHKTEIIYFFSNKNPAGININLFTTSKMLENILNSMTKDDVGNIISKFDFAGISPDDLNSFRDKLFEAIFERDINYVLTNVNFINLGKNQQKESLFLKKITDKGDLIINDIGNDFMFNGNKGNLLWKLLKVTEDKNDTTKPEVKLYIQYSAEMIKGLLVGISEQDWKNYVGYKEINGKINPVLDSVVGMMLGISKKRFTKSKLKDILDIQ